ncbi:MAG: hypothetical protein QXY94_06070 [Archaeoglobaceae archaeon]
MKKPENGIADCKNEELRKKIINNAETIAEAILDCRHCSSSHRIRYELKEIADNVLFIIRKDVNPCHEYDTFQVDVFIVFDVDDFVEYVREQFMEKGEKALIINYAANEKYILAK